MSTNLSLTTRREFLRQTGLLGSSAALLGFEPAHLLAQAQVAQADQVAQVRAAMGATPIAATPLTERITMLTGPGGNVVVLRGPDGKVVVDTFLRPAWARLEATLSRMGNERIATLIDTHWHFDHADNNASFRKAGAAIVAHENTKRRLSESHVLLGASIPPAPVEALPTQTFKAIHTIDANGEKITLGHIPPAHTDTDIYISFQNTNVLQLGDVFSNGSYPFIDAGTGGSIDGMIHAASMASKMADAKTRIVPGHGPVGDLAALERYRDMLVAVRDRVATLRTIGHTLQEVIAAAPSKEFDATWGAGFMNPAAFLGLVYHTI
jgi:glyoxylase-like metal-dependent hydrolase (beta-lactamase superfamily II)